MKELDAFYALVTLGFAGLACLFATARLLELLDIYSAEPQHLALHAALALGACTPLAGRLCGAPRILLLSLIFGAARYRMDAQVYAPPPGTSLKGTVAVVTGATSGMGLVLAHELVALEATVFLGCRNLTKCERLRPAGARATCLPLDLDDLASVHGFARALRARTGRLDYLVNNAGSLTPAGARTVQGLEASFGSFYLGHYLLTRELWSLLQAAHPGAWKPARVVNHASAAFMTADFRSLLEGDGEADLRGEVMDGCLPFDGGLLGVLPMARSLAHFYRRMATGAPAAAGASLCPVAGVYSRAKLAQVLFTQELQARADALRAVEPGRREVRVHTLHPGSVRSGIVPLPDWFVRPTAMGARVLLSCLLEEHPAGAFVDEMQAAHDLGQAGGATPQAGRPDGCTRRGSRTADL